MASATSTMLNPRQQNRFKLENAMIRTSSRRVLDMQDPVVVQEQLLLMARIKHQAVRESGMSPICGSSSTSFTRSLNTCGVATRSNRRNTQNDAGMATRTDHKQEQPQVDDISAMKRKMRQHDDFDETGPAEIYSGQQLRIRGKKHTWKAIAEGNATLVHCAGCRRSLQVDTAAELVYCSRCGAVFPRHLETDTDGERGTKTEHEKPLNRREEVEKRDARIAAKMQEQEYDARLYKKREERQSWS